GLNPEMISQWLQHVEVATGRKLEDRVAQRQSEKADWHDPANLESHSESTPPAASQVSGYQMEEVQSEWTPAERNPSSKSPLFMLMGLVWTIPFLSGFAVQWMRRI